MDSPHKRRLGSILAAALVAAVLTSACHDESDVKVSSLKFSGNQAFKGKDLAKVMVTEATGWLPWARPRFFNRAVFDDDLERLVAFYYDRGYPDAKVAKVDVQFNDKKDAVSLNVTIDEGAPLLVERIDFTGLEAVAVDVVDRLKSLPLKVGAPRDRQAVAASRERVTFVLKDSGYAFARVESEEQAGTTPRQVIVSFGASPGIVTNFGDITVVGTRTVKPLVVERGLTFKPGDLYQVSKVNESQRRLARLGIFDFAHVTADSKIEVPRTPLPMIATVSEGKPQRIELGVGYGTDEGPRGSVKWEHLNFFGDARRFSTEARYGKRLRGTGVEFLEPHLLTHLWSFNARAGSWWSDEPTFSSRRIGGQMGVIFRKEAGQGPDVSPTSFVFKAGYLHDALDYTIDPLVLADFTQFDQFIAMGLDPITGRGHGRLAALDVDLERTAIDFPADPHSGNALLFHFKYAAPWLGGSYRFDELMFEGRVFFPISEQIVWASRGRIGSILAKPAAGVPVSERYFLGGSANMRGWGRYEVAPLTKDGLPVGGKALVDLSTELRMPLRGSLSGVVFLDAGNVWASPANRSFGDLLYAAGPGLRWTSPIGVVRADYAWQITRLPGLRIDGEPERFRWRIHFTLGHTF